MTGTIDLTAGLSAAADSGRTMRIALRLDPPQQPSSPPKQPAAPRKPAERQWLARRFLRDTPFYQLLESVYDAVAITSPDGTILEANARAADFFRTTVPSLCGSNVVSLISGADPSLISTVARNLMSRKFTLIEARAKRSDGTSFPAEIAVNSVQLDPEGELSFFFRDVSVRHEAQRKLQEAVERLETQDRARLEFVSNCSHELRTPLTSMIYAVENMLRGVAGPLPEKAVDYLERLRSDSKRLLGTVNDILDLRQIETHTLAVVKSPSPLSAVVRDGAGPALVQATVKKISIDFDFPRAELFSNCDARKISRVVMNIVGNAVKFTQAGGGIRVSLASEGGEAVVTVDDNGPGVSQENLPRLSQRYFHSGDVVGGTGLGLAISREIVDLHGGSISFDSPVPGTEAGTRVAFRLPLCEPPAVTVAGFDPQEAAALAQGVTEAGWKGCAAADYSPDALARECRKVRPAALVLLPDPDDLGKVRETIIKIREGKGTKFLPVVLFVRQRLPRADVEIARAFNLLTVRLPWRQEALGGLLSQAVLGTIR